jgi:hypothetical protein
MCALFQTTRLGLRSHQLDASRKDWIEEITFSAILTLLVQKRMEFLP